MASNDVQPRIFLRVCYKDKNYFVSTQTITKFFSPFTNKRKGNGEKILRNDRSQSGFTRNDNVSGTVPDTF